MSVRQQIIEITKSPLCVQLSFTIGKIHLDGSDYKKVSEAIANYKIRIVQDPKKSSDSAEYQTDHACFVIGQTIDNDTVIHEATHAIQDMAGRPVDAYDSECVCYVAQTAFILLVSNIPLTTHEKAARFASAKLSECRKDGTKCGTAIGNASAAIALDVLGGSAPRKEDVKVLWQAVAASPRYKNTKGTYDFDGLDNDRFYSPEDLNRLGYAELR